MAENKKKLNAMAEAQMTFVPRNAAFRQQPTSVVSPPELVELSPSERTSLCDTQHFQMLFVLEGTAEVWDAGLPVGALHSGLMYLLPMGPLVNLRAIEAFRAINFHFTPSIYLCGMQCPPKEEVIEAYEQNTASGEDFGSLQITKLPLSEGVENWLSAISLYAEHKVRDVRLFDVKLQELFLLLRLTYSKEDQHTYLRYFHCKNPGFRAKVYRNHLNWHTVEEMGEGLGISHSHLKRIFLDEFGIPPVKWLMVQRARYIYRDLIEGKLSLQEISDRYHFSSPSYMATFVRRMLGDSPMRIRSQAMTGSALGE